MNADGPVERPPRMPRQIRFIVGNEGCERFGFYGMRSILVIFMTQHLLMSEAEAKVVFHLFVASCYLLPLVGAMISDRFLGKYRTILYLSFVYCAGHAALAFWDGREGLYLGLALIAVGSGGIKPCVSALVGDQFTQRNKHLVKKVFELFYWMVNFGSFFSTLLIPWLRAHHGPHVAFAVPGVLMGVATLVFWLGRHHYVRVPPTRSDPNGFVAVLSAALTRDPLGLFCTIAGLTGVIGLVATSIVAVVLNESSIEYALNWITLLSIGTTVLGGVVARFRSKSLLSRVEGQFPASSIEGAGAALRVMRLFFVVSVFWALWDQHSSTWILQAKVLDRRFWGIVLEPDQIPAINPILVMVLIPTFSAGLYPLLLRLGIDFGPLRRITVGMVVAAISFFMVAAIQLALDRGALVHVGFQLAAFVVLTSSEVLVSITGLEFAYTQAPLSVKSTIMSFWLLTTFFGNVLTAYVERFSHFGAFAKFVFFGILMLAVAAIFGAMGKRHPVRDYIREADD